MPFGGLNDGFASVANHARFGEVAIWPTTEAARIGRTARTLRSTWRSHVVLSFCFMKLLERRYF
ncbi:MAG: hypothetical protein WDN48_14470 [Pseudolabrys sp.]